VGNGVRGARRAATVNHPVGPHMIELRQLRKHYKMGDSIVHALDGADLDIGAGEFVSLTGASGSGKSTMMHLIGCLDRPTSGSYRLDGMAVNKMSDRQLAMVRNRHIGFVFQTFNLINRTSAVDNVAVPLIYSRKTSTRNAAMAALEKVGLTQRATHKPSELSGGERQRVAIARAIVNEPKLILADEPTGNLDTRTGEQIMRIFHQLHATGTTVILVTHEMDVAAQAKRIIRMRDGKIVADEMLDDEKRSALQAEAYAASQPVGSPS
jgi:putative ABC transport system ATP-binding protein